MIYAGAITPQRLILFMRRLTKDAKRKVFLILDNLNVHKSSMVKDWLLANAKRIEVFYLPPYSPELNRIEPVFEQVKHHEMPTRSFTTRADPVISRSGPSHAACGSPTTRCIARPASRPTNRQGTLRRSAAAASIPAAERPLRCRPQGCSGEPYR